MLRANLRRADVCVSNRDRILEMDAKSTEKCALNDARRVCVCVVFLITRTRDDGFCR